MADSLGDEARDMTAALILGSRYCDVCGGMPWWEQPLLVVIGLAIAIAILAGLLRLSAWFSRRRSERTRRRP